MRWLPHRTLGPGGHEAHTDSEEDPQRPPFRVGAAATHRNTKNKFPARALGGQADTAKQALEARVRAEAINPQVSFEKP